MLIILLLAGREMLVQLDKLELMDHRDFLYVDLCSPKVTHKNDFFLCL